MRTRFTLLPFAIALFALPLTLGCSGEDGSAGPAGPEGPAGATGPAGENAVGEPSISSVTPSKAFLGRKAEVVISGNGTTWDDSTTVDFGAGVTVASKVVASPTAIIAQLEIGNDVVGAHDVKIGALTYKQGFKTIPAIDLTTQGKLAQGSIAVMSAKQLDFTTPFDTSYTGDGFFTPIVYTGVKINEIAGVTTDISAVGSYSCDFLAYIDVTAAASENDIDVLSGPAGSQTHNIFPKALKIEERAPVELVAGTPATGNIEKAWDSTLYKFTPTAGIKLLEIAASTSSADGTPAFMMLPKSGSFADAIAFSQSVSFANDAADPFYLVVLDGNGAYGYDYKLAANLIDVPNNAVESTDNETSAKAQALSALPFLVYKGTLSGATDEDWFKYTATAADVGKTLQIKTMGIDSQTDTTLEAFESDGTTSLGAGDDSGYHEEITTDKIPAAGDIFIKVAASEYFSTSHKNYELYVRLK